MRRVRNPQSGAPAIAEIEDARRLLSTILDPTPILPAPWLSRLAGREVCLKPENLHPVGSFKIRGACNRIARLDKPHGVVAASAGNHAQGVAVAAGMSHLTAVIVMPEETPLIKIDRTRAYGAEVILHGALFEDAYRRACEVRDERGLTLVHAYEDRDVIAGQGTIGLEIAQEREEIGAVVVPVGGGGLISGIALAIKSRNPKTAVVGVQARGASPTVRAFRAARRGRPAPRTSRRNGAETIADAIRFKTASEVTLPIIREHVDEMVDVTEEEIAEAIVRLMEESKLVAEAAGAVGVAALMAGRIPRRFGSVCIVISGGNIDLNMTARLLEQGLSRADRYLVLRILIPDKPGRLFGILAHMAARKINVLDVRHNRAGWRIPLGWVEVEALVETRDAAHARDIVRSLRKAGYRAERAEREERS